MLLLIYWNVWTIWFYHFMSLFIMNIFCYTDVFNSFTLFYCVEMFVSIYQWWNTHLLLFCFLFIYGDEVSTWQEPHVVMMIYVRSFLNSDWLIFARYQKFPIKELKVSWNMNLVSKLSGKQIVVSYWEIWGLL